MNANNSFQAGFVVVAKYHLLMLKPGDLPKNGGFLLYGYFCNFNHSGNYIISYWCLVTKVLQPYYKTNAKVIHFFGKTQFKAKMNLLEIGANILEDREFGQV